VSCPSLALLSALAIREVRAHAALGGEVVGGAMRDAELALLAAELLAPPWVIVAPAAVGGDRWSAAGRAVPGAST
jgi:hypothetical protein